MVEQPPSKRIRLDTGKIDPASVRASRAAFLNSLSRPVSPPPSSSTTTRSTVPKQSTGQQTSIKAATTTSKSDAIDIDLSSKSTVSLSADSVSVPVTKLTRTIPSPIQLSQVRDLSAADNVDTVSLHDILGDPLIREAWIFNFCFDVDWLMQHFDTDIREMVDVKIVHGSWRREDTNKIRIDEACARWPNVKAITAYLPDAFGTHHSKMFVLFRHDDQAQVIIHTANMLASDWTNMTQAVWRSPLLPVLKHKTTSQSPEEPTLGAHFKEDLVRYLRAYQKLGPLVKQVQQYDFKDVKAAIVASVPSKFKISAPSAEVWGHEMLRRKLQAIQTQPSSTTSEPHFVFQVSSIASLAANWLKDTLYSACSSTQESTSIIFPTASDVAQSLDGYAAGGSIHTKAQLNVHLQQISRLRSQLCRWTQSQDKYRSGRDLAAPHIKTYVRFAFQPTKGHAVPDIDWALVTSANLSTQAWGSSPKLPKGVGEAEEAIIHVQSYEIGVLVWPGAFADDQEGSSKVTMVPCFGKNMPDGRYLKADTVVGFRMPYDLPLTQYTEEEMPWSPGSSYCVTDRHGRVW